jgi:hypothetical protein
VYDAEHGLAARKTRWDVDREVLLWFGVGRALGRELRVERPVVER